MTELLKKVTFALVIILVIPLYSQRMYKLTYDETLNIAFSKSYEILDVKSDLERDRLFRKAEIAALKSNAYMNLSLPDFDQSIKQEFNSELGIYQFYKTKQTKLLSSISINQPIITNGNLSLNSDFFRLSQENSLNYSTSLFIKFVQPLFTTNRLKRNIRVAELNYERTEIRALERMAENFGEDLVDEFYELYEAKVLVEIDSLDREIALNSYNAAIKQYERGEIDELDLLKVKISLNKSNETYLNSRYSLYWRKVDFKHLIGLSSKDKIQIITDFKYRPVKINLDNAIEIGIRNSVELRNSQIEIERTKYRIEDADSWREFKGYLTATYGIEKTDEKFNDLFNNLNKTRSISLTLDLPLWDWGRNKFQVNAVTDNLKNNELSLDFNKESLIIQIRESVRDVNVALSRLEVLELNRNLAEKSYSDNLKEFKDNNITSQDLIFAQYRLTRARKNYLDAFIEYKMAIARLAKLTYWDFEKNRSVKEFLFDFINNK